MTDICSLPGPVHLSLPLSTLCSIYILPLSTLSLPLSILSAPVYTLNLSTPSPAVYPLSLSLYAFPLSFSLTLYIVSIKILELFRKAPKHISKNSDGKNKHNPFLLAHTLISPYSFFFFLFKEQIDHCFL